MQAVGYTLVHSCLNNKSIGKKCHFDLQIFVDGGNLFQFPMKCFEIAEFQVTNYPYHLTLLLLFKPCQHQGGGWVPGGTEDGLQTTRPCSGGNARGRKSISFLRQVRSLPPALTLQTALSLYSPSVMVPE